MRRTFKYLDTKSFLVIYKTLVRTHLDYASSVWAPYKMKYIEKIESVQKRVTKQFPGMKNLSYPERLKKLGLLTLTYRRIRGDMIEVYKIIKGCYDREASSFLKLMNETGLRFSSRINSNKIVHQHVKSNKRKYAFTLRVSRIWNKLPDTVVNAPTLNTFKNRLDRYWKNQDLFFNNYKSDIQWDCHVTNECLEVESEESGEEDLYVLSWKITISNHK
jgi:hypothetical protein